MLYYNMTYKLSAERFRTVPCIFTEWFRTVPSNPKNPEPFRTI